MSRTLAVDVIKNHRFIISGNEPALLLFAFLLATLILANGCRTAQKHAAARPQARDGDGYTALFFAAYNYPSEDANGATIPMVKLLLSHGANVNAAAHDRSTPVIWAAGKGEGDIIRVLAAAGADLNATDASGKTP